MRDRGSDWGGCQHSCVRFCYCPTAAHCSLPLRSRTIPAARGAFGFLGREVIGLAEILRHVVQFPLVVIHVYGLTNGPRRQRRRSGGNPTIAVDGAIGEHLGVLSAVGRGRLRIVSARTYVPLPRNAGRTGTSQRPNSQQRGSKAARNSSIRTAKRPSKLSVNRLRRRIAI